MCGGDEGERGTSTGMRAWEGVDILFQEGSRIV